MYSLGMDIVTNAGVIAFVKCIIDAGSQIQRISCSLLRLPVELLNIFLSIALKFFVSVIPYVEGALSRSWYGY